MNKLLDEIEIEKEYNRIAIVVVELNALIESEEFAELADHDKVMLEQRFETAMAYADTLSASIEMIDDLKRLANEH